MLKLVKRMKRGGDKVLADTLSHCTSSRSGLDGVTTAKIYLGDEHVLRMTEPDATKLVRVIANRVHAFAADDQRVTSHISYLERGSATRAASAKWLREIADQIEQVSE